MAEIAKPFTVLAPDRGDSRPRTAPWWRHATCVALLTLAGVAGPACTGTIEGSPPMAGSDATPDAAPGMGRTVEIIGPAVLPHVQAFADAACNAVGACHPSTYVGHDPSADRALDTLVSDAYGSVPSDNNALGDAHAAFALAHQQEYVIWYVIWQQRINFGQGWEPMEDRGSITQNHYDHVHVSFNVP
ncbi:MAG: Group surface immunogenic protein [Deltaproteobacteria bacterium]|nr:Group surface immunogenic protein [Deltaproteobacteria bacterium]